MVSAAAVLPPLRQDLGLYPADPETDGSPSWTLHDPAAHRFFRIGWPAFEILSRWGLGRAEAVARAVRAETTLAVEEADVQGVAEMLARGHLVETGASAQTRNLYEAWQRSRLSWGRWLLEHYLFFRIPLWRPMPLLARLAPLTGWAFAPGFWWTLLALLGAGLFLISRQWDVFTHSFTTFSQWSGWLGLALALSFSKVLHEFGHALAAYRLGCRVPAMGVAFLVMWPMLYTDVNESWKLPRREQRLQVAAAGILTELALAALATFAWSFVEEGPVKVALFMLATSTWIITLGINASPFMRFDGYFLLSDWLGIDNLHPRAFAFGRWWLRERLFALGAQPPEALSPGRTHFMILFAYATWLYRLVLFLGIALLVYHFFFKLLGILLMAVELGWFIARPLWLEAREWVALREQIGQGRRWLFSLLLLLGGGVLLALPLHTTVQAPAMLTLAQRQALYAPLPGLLQEAPPAAGQSVAAGQTLLRLHSPDLRHQAELARFQAQSLRWQQERQSLSEILRTQAGALGSRAAQADSAIGAWRREQNRLDILAPLDGVVLEVNDQLHAGGWVAKDEWLALVGRRGALRVEAYVEEADLQRLHVDAPARFVPESSEWPSFACRVADIDRLNVEVMEHPALAKEFGGAIAAVGDLRRGVAPAASHFRVRLDRCEVPVRADFELRGTVHIEAERVSPLVRMVRHAHGVLIREAGF